MKLNKINLSDRLQEMGYDLPKLNPPIASYVPAKSWNNLIFVSGQLPLQEQGKRLMMEGKMTMRSSLAEAQKAIAQCFLNGLAAAIESIPSTDEIKGVLRLGAYIACESDFTQHHLVANGASNLAQELFGKQGLHSRSAIGVPSLPLDSTVELEITFYT